MRNFYPWAITFLFSLTNILSYSQNEWKQVSHGFYGGQVLSLASVSETIFAGTVGGLYRSTDNGNTWTRLQEGLDGKSVNSLVSVSSTLYMALNGGGTYLTVDLGETWQLINIPESKTIVAMEVIGSTIYALSNSGALFSISHGTINATEINTGLEGVSSITSSGSTLFLGTVTNGLYSSANAGSSWTKIISDPIINDVYALDSEGALVIAWTNAGMLSSTNGGGFWKSMNYNKTAKILGTINDFLLAGTSDDVSISYDNGFSWTDLPNLPAMTCITSNTAGTYVGTMSGIYRSLDSGATWEETNTGIISGNIRSMAILNNKLYASHFNMIYRSSDWGNSWEKLNTYFPYGQGVLCLKAIGSNILAGTEQGTFISSDEGETWTMINSSGATSFAQHGNDVYSSFYSGILISKDNGLNWNSFSDIRFANTMAILENDLYVANDKLQRISLGGANQTPVVLTAPQNISSLTSIGNKLFCGSNVGVFESINKGETWTSLNNSLSGNYFVDALTSFDQCLYLSRPGEGVDYSRNNSGFWNFYSDGFPSKIYLKNDISELAVLGGKLYAGTTNAAVWSICPLFTPPIITATNILTETPTLTSSWASGNQWFLNGAAIAGATGHFITVNESGVYHVELTTPAGCQSPPSADLDVVIVGDVSALEDSRLNIYPNPATQQLNINLNNFENDQPVKIEIFDMLGKSLVKLNGYGGESISLETVDYPSGMYLIRCGIAGSFYTSRFTTQR